MLTALERKIRIIKHFVDRTEGFTFCNEGDDICPEYMLKHHHWEFWPSGSDFVTTGMWSLFLQRAIEGVELLGKYEFQLLYSPLTNHWLVHISKNGIRGIGETPDDAKLAALEWIMEKESES